MPSPNIRNRPPTPSSSRKENAPGLSHKHPVRGQIVVSGLGRDYLDGEKQLTVLNDVSFSIEPGQFVAITGPSGSGKSTLLGLLAGLDRPTRGEVQIDGVPLSGQSEDQLSRFRGRNIGFVFQSFQLIPTLTALENVSVPAELLGRDDWAARAPQLLERVGLSERMNHYPSQLSGGEMQRVAIARATITEPAVLLADEPTGNLDAEAAETVMSLLLEANRQSTLVLVTHNAELAARAHRQICMRHGAIAEIVERAASTGSES